MSKKTDRDELIESLQKSFNDSANLLIGEIRKKVSIIVHSKVEMEYDQIVKKLNDTIEKLSNKSDDLIDALIEVTAHVMMQNKILSDTLVKKGVMVSEDIEQLEKDLDKNVHLTIKYINKSIGRKKTKSTKRRISLAKMFKKINGK